jgi:hypothetical protein
MAKDRTMNELRQTKDTVYKVPTHDPQTGELNPNYEEVTGQNNPWDVYGRSITESHYTQYYVIHREQVTLNLQIEEFETKEEADKKRHYLRQHYHDSIILDYNDINSLYLKVRSNSIKKIKDTNNK